jgi:hypothetical protein
MRRPDLQRVAPHPERPAREEIVVALVLLRRQLAHHRALVVLRPDLQVLRHRPVGLDRPDAVDAGDRGDDHHVVAFQQGAGGGVAHPVDLLVDLRFLFDIGVGARHIGFRLVIIVVAYKILHRIIREK